MDSSGHPVGPSFTDLAASRRAWIDDVLKPWARQARRADLLLAEQEWTDIAGKVDPAKTLWAWAWGRFPDLVHEDLGIDESREVTVQLRDGRRFCGYPDSRQSQHGKLVLYGRLQDEHSYGELGPFSIDEVITVEAAGA